MGGIRMSRCANWKIPCEGCKPIIWMSGKIHEVVYWNDPDLIFAPNGAIEALAKAKQQGKVRFVGFTGHKDPRILLKMLSHNFPLTQSRCRSTASTQPFAVLSSTCAA